MSCETLSECLADLVVGVAEGNCLFGRPSILNLKKILSHDDEEQMVTPWQLTLPRRAIHVSARHDDTSEEKSVRDQC